MDGLETITQMRAHWPHIAVVILTTYNEDNLMLRGLRAGACGYLLKDVNRETLLHSIRRAARGETLLQPEVFARLLSLTQPDLSSDSAAERAKKTDKLDLTERERSILTGVARGERSKEIAARLGITAATVAAHLTNIYAKLGADSRASAVAIALQRGLLSMEEENDTPSTD
jgi:NarL family two-component system response regulator YdfI